MAGSHPLGAESISPKGTESFPNTQEPQSSSASFSELPYPPLLQEVVLPYVSTKEESRCW